MGCSCKRRVFFSRIGAYLFFGPRGSVNGAILVARAKNKRGVRLFFARGVPVSPINTAPRPEEQISQVCV